MSRRPHLSLAAAALALPIAATLAACGSSAPITPHIADFPQTAGAPGQCGSIMDALPNTLINQPRTTSTGSADAAVWGSPNIVLRCGVPEPASFEATSPCMTVNGIDWYLEGNPPSGTGGVPSGNLVVVTVYRTPAVEVTVPASYGTQGPGTAMAQLTSVIGAHTTVSQHCQ